MNLLAWGSACSKLIQSLEQTKPQPFMSPAPGEALSLVWAWCPSSHGVREAVLCYKVSGSIPARLLPPPEWPCGAVKEAGWKSAHFSLLQAYLESFYKFCKALGGTTADAMCPILEVGLETPVVILTQHSAHISDARDIVQHPRAA